MRSYGVGERARGELRRRHARARGGASGPVAVRRGRRCAAAAAAIAVSGAAHDAASDGAACSGASSVGAAARVAHPLPVHQLRSRSAPLDPHSRAPFNRGLVRNPLCARSNRNAHRRALRIGNRNVSASRANSGHPAGELRESRRKARMQRATRSRRERHPHLELPKRRRRLCGAKGPTGQRRRALNDRARWCIGCERPQRTPPPTPVARRAHTGG